MSESIKIGAIRNNPQVDRINDVSAEGIRELAKTKIPDLVVIENQGEDRFAGTKYRKVDLKFQL